MANPNIVSVTSILGNTTFLTPADTTANVLLSNAASSGDVLKINQIVAANVNGTSAVDTTVAINNAAAGAVQLSLSSLRSRFLRMRLLS
jgi:predicted membrane protein